MAKRLRVLSINFQFKTQGVDFAPSLDTTKALFDFDVVLLRPHSLAGFMSGHVSKRGAEWWLDRGSDFTNAGTVVRGKMNDIAPLLQKGGLFVIVLDTLEVYKWDPYAYSIARQEEIETLTNYDFLGQGFYQCVHNGSGSGITYTDASDPFARVLQHSNVRWSAYLDSSLTEHLNAIRFFAFNGPGQVVGAIAQIGTGHIVFLPNLQELDEEQFLVACSEYRFSREGTNPPSWVEGIYLVGEKEATEAILEVETEIKQLQDKRTSRIRHRAELLDYKKLLYEKGKTHLEPVVRRALDDLGFNTTPSETIPGSQFEIDGRTTIGSVPGMVEVKGSKNQIPFDEFSKFVPKLLEDFNLAGVQPKGIFVGNGYCEKPPQDRIGETVFSPHVLQAAKTHSIALINSVELYWLVCGVLAKEVTQYEAIRESILSASGYVDLKPFCGARPFPGDK